MVVVTIFNPLGRGRNGEENIRQLQTRDCSSLQSHPSFYHFLPSKRASSKARENHFVGHLPPFQEQSRCPPSTSSGGLAGCAHVREQELPRQRHDRARLPT